MGITLLLKTDYKVFLQLWIVGNLLTALRVDNDGKNLDSKSQVFF